MVKEELTTTTDKVGHLTQEFPLPRKPWCSHWRVNSRATEYCPKLIAMWEDHVRKIGKNSIQVKPHPREKGYDSTINVVTHGEIWTRLDKYILVQESTQRASPRAPKFDPLKQKEVFKELVEMFHQIPSTPMDKHSRCQWDLQVEQHVFPD